jgi:thiamine kinase-like enzyme
MNGGTSGNCIIKKSRNHIQKTYKKSGHKSFMNELYIYLLAKQKNLSYIPELLSYNVEKRILKIKNVGKSLSELYKGEKKKEELIPKIIKEYNKLVKLGFYHNDLRYKNVIYNEEQNKYYLIDFEYTSTKFTDKDHDHIIKPLKRSNRSKKKKKK